MPVEELQYAPFYSAALALMGIALILPNGLVVLLYAHAAELRREPSHVLIVNFCCCSLVLGFVVCPYHIFTFLKPCVVLLHRQLCTLRYSLMGYVNLVNVLNSFFMVLERFLVIHFPFRADLLTRRSVAVLAGLPWLLCLFLFAMHYDTSWRPGNCDFIQSTAPVISRVPAIVLLPAVAIAVLLLLSIWRTAVKQRRKISVVERLTGCTASRNRATRTVLMIAALFSVCYLPVAALFLIQSVQWHNQNRWIHMLDTVRFAATMLAAIICIVCPLLVLVGSKAFRTEVKRFLKCS